MDISQNLLFLWALGSTLLLLIAVLLYLKHFMDDNGHRLLGIRTEEARIPLLQVLKRFGFTPRITFDLGPKGNTVSRQTLLNDGVTVIHCLSPEFTKHMNATGASLRSKDPLRDAHIAAEMLRKNGIDATVLLAPKEVIPEDFLVIVSSPAFEGWTLTFRQASLIYCFRMFKKYLHVVSLKLH